MKKPPLICVSLFHYSLANIKSSLAFLRVAISGVALFFLWGITASQAQIVYDNNGQAIGQAGANSITISNFSVPAGTNRLLVVCTFSINGAPTGATFGGSAMTKQITTAQGASNVSLFTLPLGTSGSANMGDIIAEGASMTNMGAKSYHFVDQTTPADNFTGTSGTSSTSSSLPVTSATNDLVCDCLGTNRAITILTLTAGSGQTQTFHNNAGTFGASRLVIGSSHEAGAANVTMSWTMSSSAQAYAHSAMNLNYAPPLPVELMSFQAEQKPLAVHLAWHTASEANNSGFQIERSNDGQNWEDLTFVPGHGTSYEAHSYTHIDERPLPGMNYYRLRQMDFDGESEYSQAVSVDFKTGGTWAGEFYPNPVQGGTAYLDFQTEVPGQWTATVYGPMGKVLYHSDRYFEEGEQRLEFDLSGLSAGLYWVKIGNGGAYFSRSLMVK